MENAPGICLVGVHLAIAEVPLLLVWDEEGANEGASVTNAIAHLLQWLQERWPDFPVRQCVVVEHDSMGYFDHAYPEWSSENPAVLPTVGWKPLRWPGATPRTEEAFLGLFGLTAREALHSVQELKT